MRDIPLNAKIMCADGNWGKSSHAIFMPSAQEVTHIVVYNPKFDDHKRLVPIERVLETSPQSIRLNCTTSELAAMEAFSEIHYVMNDGTEYNPVGFYTTFGIDDFPPFMNWSSMFPPPEFYIPVEEERIPPGELAVRFHAQVKAIDGSVGQIDELIVDPDNHHITHLVIRTGHFWNLKELTLPISAIKRIEEDRVYLNLDRNTFQSLPTVPTKHFYNRQVSKIET